jgi:hypothetical protein
MTVRIEKVIATVRHEGQVEETMDTLFEEPEDLYKIPY